MLKLIFSNRLEVLAKKLSDEISGYKDDPFEKDLVILPSSGMGKWLQLRLASYHGISANLEFPFPKNFIFDSLEMVLGKETAENLYSKERMLWMIFGLLEKLQDRDEFSQIRNYLSGTETELKGYQLSEKIASVFDDYVVFRSDMVEGWLKGENHQDDWQPVLFSAISEESRGERMLLSSVLREFSRRLRTDAGLFPKRISIFGISTMPKLFLEFFKIIAQHSDVFIYGINPSKEYWFDLRTEKSIAKEEAASGFSKDDLHLEEGNSLLALMGQEGKEWISELISSDSEECSEYLEPSGKKLLHHIQADILNLREGRLPGDPGIQGDESLQLHSCHSRMREVEVLYDSILEVLARDPSMSPSDIIVLAPEIEEYAPLIESVFSCPYNEKNETIPYRVSDSTLQEETDPVKIFLKLLGIRLGKLGAPEIMDIISSDALREKFDLSQDDILMISSWISRSGIRWGYDEKFRESLNLPAFREGSWVAGLDRLMLGYYMPSDEEDSFMGISPLSLVTTDGSILLGKLIKILDLLKELYYGLLKSRTASGWKTFLYKITSDFYSEALRDKSRELFNALDLIGKIESEYSFKKELSIAIIEAELKRYFSRAESGRGFLGRGLTFCKMLPMRSLPFRMVAVLGLNDGDFPRKDRPIAFNMITNAPRPLDRSIKKDDRYMFLETILSAGDILYLSYLGQSLKDNSQFPPSTLISELVEYCEKNYGTDRKSLVFQEHMQAFHPDYFSENSPLKSFSVKNYRIARQLIYSAKSPRLFFKKDMPEEPSFKARVPENLQIDQFISFFRNPSKYFIKEGLGLSLDDYEDRLEENEVLEPNALERYFIQDEILRLLKAGRKSEEIYRIIRAKSLLPPGVPGEILLADSYGTLKNYFHEVKDALKGKEEKREISVRIGGLNLTGSIELYGGVPATVKAAGIKPKDILALWIRSLIYFTAEKTISGNVSEPQGLAFGLQKNKCKKCRFLLPRDTEGKLGSLVSLYRGGLKRPLRFFVDLAESLIKQDSDDYSSIERKFYGSGNYARAIIDDPYVELLYREMSPIDQEAKSIASEIYGPILDAINRGKNG